MSVMIRVPWGYCKKCSMDVQVHVLKTSLLKWRAMCERVCRDCWREKNG